jgi:hypothetical protein
MMENKENFMKEFLKKYEEKVLIGLGIFNLWIVYMIVYLREFGFCGKFGINPDIIPINNLKGIVSSILSISIFSMYFFIIFLLGLITEKESDKNKKSSDIFFWILSFAVLIIFMFLAFQIITIISRDFQYFYIYGFIIGMLSIGVIVYLIKKSKYNGAGFILGIIFFYIFISVSFFNWGINEAENIKELRLLKKENILILKQYDKMVVGVRNKPEEKIKIKRGNLIYMEYPQEMREEEIVKKEIILEGI